MATTETMKGLIMDLQITRKSFIALAMLLSSATALTIAMTVFSLIADPFIASLFAGAAIGLDVLKYVSWPLVVRMCQVNKYCFAIALACCSISLSVISGWATYDRLFVSIAGSDAEIRAMKGDHLDYLKAQVESDSRILQDSKPVIIDSTGPEKELLKNLYGQSAELRARGMVSKAAELESSTIAATEQHRQQIAEQDLKNYSRKLDEFAAEQREARSRIDKNSSEVLRIESMVERGASIPDCFIILVCVGFAVGLEVFPSLILAALASLRVAHHQTASTEPVAVPDCPAGDLEHHEPVTHSHVDQDVSTEIRGYSADDEHLVKQLLEMISMTAPGGAVKIEDFATKASVGTRRASSLFKLAADAGFIEIRGKGYKKCLTSKENALA